MANEKETLVEEEKKESLESRLYKCENCGNFLQYDPETKKLKCEHCDSLYDLETVSPCMELAYYEGVEGKYEGWGGVKCVRCDACGAVTILNEYETTCNCAFCGAPNVVVSDELPGLKPNGVLPFRITKQTAIDSYTKWMKKKIFAPFNLKKTARTQNMKGIYIPMFTFDASAVAKYEIRYGEHYTVTVGSGKNRRTETRTRWYNDRGTTEASFDDIQVEASQNITQKDLRKLGGFDTQSCVGYHSQFLSGYNSERYSTSLDESWGTATQLMTSSISNQIRGMYPQADVIDYIHVDPRFFDTTYKYVLVPIWNISYKYKKKQYGCIISGRNGRSVGNYPKSIGKIATTALVLGAAVGALIYFLFKYFL